MDRSKLRLTWQSSDWNFNRSKKLKLSIQSRMKTEPKLITQKIVNNPSTFHEYVQMIQKKYKLESKPIKRNGNCKSLQQLFSTRSLIKFESQTNLPQIN